MNKLGNGNDLDQMIRTYIEKVEKSEKEVIINSKVEKTDEKNEEIMNYCKKIDNEMMECIQKMGIVRYNAFKDTGSDLSFTLALLDKYNNGVVLNGIYARDSSNIYAKPVENGESKYVLSNEEKEAIQKAIESK